MATITARLSTTVDAAVTNGSQVARAKAAPAAAAATAVEAVWQVAKSPCTLPTCAGSDPWVNIDWPAGNAAANPSASNAASTISAGTLWTKGYEAHRAADRPIPATTSTRRSMWSANQPLGLAAITNGTAKSVHDRPISHPDAPRDTSSRVQQMS